MIHWQGKVAIVACVTPTIDKHHSVTSVMGERFIFSRLPEIDGDAQSRLALSHVGKEDRMRREMSEAVSRLFADLVVPADLPSITEDEESKLIGLTGLVVRLRSAVERHAYTREIEFIPEPESPARLTLALRRLLSGMLMIGVETGEAWRVLRNVALDSAPLLRRRVFELLAMEATEYETAKLATKLAYPTQTTRRALEELHAHGLIQRATRGPGKADRWSVSEQWEMQYALVAQPFPKCRES